MNEIDYEVECFEGVADSVSEFTFADAASDYYTTMCTTNMTLYSMYAAAKIYCTPAEIQHGQDVYAGYCSEYGDVTLVPYATILPYLTDAYIASMQVVNFENINATRTWNNSVLISEDLYKTGRMSDSTFDEEYWLHTVYGWGLLGYWGGVITLGMIYRLISTIMGARRGDSGRDVEKTAPQGTSLGARSPSQTWLMAPYYWVKTNIALPPVFGSRHQQVLRWGYKVPTRLEFLIVGSYWVLNIGLCSASYTIFWPNLYYSEAMQTWRYLSDRTGILAYANLPFLFMFSGRNNTFIWATGWNFATFNVFHRNIATIATIEAIIHSVGYTITEMNGGYYTDDWPQAWFYMGAVATCVMSLILLFSFNIVREKFYEFFLLVHIAFSVVMLVGLFYHTIDEDYNDFLWACIAIWCFDRFIRIIRLLYCNLHVKFSGHVQHTVTTASYNRDADIVRIEVTPGSEFLKPKPSQYYFLYQPLRWRGWENHPFTIGAWEPVGASHAHQVDSQRPVSSTLVGKDETSTSILQDSSSKEISSSSDSTSSNSPPSTSRAGHYKLIFYIRPFDGWTRRLRDNFLKREGSTMKVRMMIEGPYGSALPLYKYENVLFIIGGSGITAASTYIQEHGTRCASNSTRTTNMTLVWAARQSAIIRSVVAHELAPVMLRDDIRYDFHATSREESFKTIEKDIARESKPVLSDLHISYGRPNITNIVDGMIEEVAQSGRVGGRIAVLSCGPAGMVDEARMAVHHAMRRGMRHVDYFEEMFGW